MILGDRERVALARAGYDRPDLDEIEEMVAAGEAIVVVERGEARVIPTTSEGRTEAPEEEPSR
jgi:hypothetical protein